MRTAAAFPSHSASIPFSASDGEKVAQPDEVSPESGERAEVRCSLFAGDPEFKALEMEIKINWLK